MVGETGMLTNKGQGRTKKTWKPVFVGESLRTFWVMSCESLYQTAMDGCDAADHQDTTIVAHRSNIIQPCMLATKTTHIPVLCWDLRLACLLFFSVGYPFNYKQGRRLVA